MGRIGVIADSHDHLGRIGQAVELLNDRGVELVVHAGDFVAPFAVRALELLDAPVLGVLGNNDGEVVGLGSAFLAVGTLAPHLATAEVGGRRVAAVHYPELARPLAASGAYDVVVFGHTHEPLVERVGSALLLNPGELGGWLGGRATLALVDLDSLGVELIELA